MIVVYSKEDLAGTNIAKKLVWEGVEVVKTVAPLLHCEQEIKDVKTDYIIFVSKHKSETKLPCLAVHTPGNWNAAEMGGLPKELCKAVPSAMKSILMAMDRHAESSKLKSAGWRICMECTHHGPFVETPCFFVEIGSSEREWMSELAGKIVADAIITHTSSLRTWPTAFGIGGTHYCPKFTKYELIESGENSFAFSHVLPNYHASVDFETFKQGITRSSEKVSKVLVDWKGLKKEQRDRLLKFVEEMGIEWQRV